jgi:hypothetical protein
MIDPQVIVYTKLLKHRIAHSGRIDVNIFHLIEAEAPASYNEHLGRFIGWFITGGDKPGLLLLGRKQIGGPITHAFLMYPNTYYNDFPLEEQVALSRKLQPQPKLALINIQSGTEPFCDYAILLESIEFIISKDVFQEEPPQYIVLRSPGSLVSPNPRRDTISECDANTRASVDHRIIVNNNVMFVDIDQTDAIPPTFDVMRMSYQGHYVYGINYCLDDAMLILVPHIELFPGELEFVVLEEKIYRRFPGRYKTFYAVRPRYITNCDSADILKMCILLTRLPLLYVEPSDVFLSLEDLNILSIGFSKTRSNPSTPNASQRRDSANDPEYCGSKPTITVQLAGSQRRPEVLSVRNRAMSPAASINSQQVIRREINDYRAWMAAADDGSLPYPSTLVAKAANIPTGTILKRFDWLQQQLRHVMVHWQKYTQAKLLEPISISSRSRHHFDNRNERFILIPIFKESTPIDCGIMLFDKEHKKWSWLHPDNSAADSATILAHVKGQIVTKFPTCQDWSGDILVVSSSYHRDYPYVHLVMAVYRVAKCFYYSVQLPLKIVYNERDFRVYAYKYCLAVQVANQELNLKNDLVTVDGQLKDGAYVSLPSPIQYERAVVPSDICPFCKKRGFGNLGRHMSMKHGGQAQIANVTRMVQYGYTSRS